MSDKIIAALAFEEPRTESLKGPDALAEFQTKKESATRHINSMIMSVQGRVVGWLKSHLILEVDIDDSKVLKDIHDRLRKDLNMHNSVGVGESIEEALVALKEAQKENSVRVYHSDMDAPEEGTPGNTPQAVAVSEEDAPMFKAEDDDSGPISEETKQQLAMIMKTLGQHKDYISQMQQANPDVYSALVEIVQALAKVTDKAKEKDSRKKINQAKKILKLVEGIHNGELDEQEKQIIEALMAEQKNHEDEQKQAFKDASAASRLETQSLHQRSAKTAHKHGLNPRFLTGVLKIRG